MGQVVFILKKDVVLALEATTGRKVWSRNLGTYFIGNQCALEKAEIKEDGTMVRVQCPHTEVILDAEKGTVKHHIRRTHFSRRQNSSPESREVDVEALLQLLNGETE